jgi:hypothetical protein
MRKRNVLSTYTSIAGCENEQINYGSLKKNRESSEEAGLCMCGLVRTGQSAPKSTVGNYTQNHPDLSLPDELQNLHDRSELVKIKKRSSEW